MSSYYDILNKVHTFLVWILKSAGGHNIDISRKIAALECLLLVYNSIGFDYKQ